ncbi:EDD domain protein, DegV family [Clostridium cavendishii DSM 21758]|uniref:EDD domain protein, DegV family n=1 Tax=Clostridium cavendishii DSM 21758 TaxID=1121302 RepID=A0A1M6IBV1_9CLOT|nr:DegV family protein [Clostridium cavendishii]SHJ31806.1 EDD domain protein, DegV family [Clostridium cavendishii DSM 21758]
MTNFEIFTDSCCDLPIEYIKEKNIKFARLTCSFSGTTYNDDLGEGLKYKDFFNAIRKGETPITSQPSVNEFYEKFKEIIEKDLDILYICVSTGMSGTENSANIAKEMILDEFKNAKITIVNALTASLGQGLLVMKAVQLKEEGKSIEEIEKYIIENRDNLNTYMTVDDLHHLKRGGRLSTAAAFLGIMLHIKPILTINSEGRVIAIKKAKGRKGSISQLAQIVLEKIENPEEQILAISHGDCEEEALKLRDAILKEKKVKDVIMNYTGPAVGTHGGPGNIAVFFIGKPRQNHII